MNSEIASTSKGSGSPRSLAAFQRSAGYACPHSGTISVLAPQALASSMICFVAARRALSLPEKYSNPEASNAARRSVQFAPVALMTLAIAASASGHSSSSSAVVSTMTSARSLSTGTSTPCPRSRATTASSLAASAPSTLPSSTCSAPAPASSAGIRPASVRASRMTPIIGEISMPIGQIMSQRPHSVQASNTSGCHSSSSDMFVSRTKIRFSQRSGASSRR